MLPLADLYGTQFIEGDGPEDAEFMFVGEAPGEDEDHIGLPFQGPSGRLLNKTLEFWTTLRREDVYVTNIVKQRPPKNRTPKITELRKHLPYFIEELERVNPRVVVALGGVAFKVFDKDGKVTEDHGVPRPATLGEWRGMLVPWLHPAYALRSPYRKQQLGSDARKLESSLELYKPAVVDYTLAPDQVVADKLYPVMWQPDPVIGFDTETTSPTVGRKRVFATDQAELVGWSASVEAGQGWYVEGRGFGRHMKKLLESATLTKVCHNAKFEHKVLRKVGVDFRGFEDTKIAAYVLGETPTGLKPLAKQWLQVLPETYKAVTQGRDMSELTAEEIMSYAAADADNTLRLWRELEPLLHQHGVYEIYKNIELPLVPVLSRMEARGVMVDEVEVREHAEELSATIVGAIEKASALMQPLPTDFNIASPDQLEARLVEMGAPLKAKTPSGARYSVDADALENIREWHSELIGHLLNYRKYVKMQLYLIGFLELRGPDMRLHTAMNQAGHFEETGETGEAPSTGRMSSSGPNLNNIPHHRATVEGVDWGNKIRRCLVATPAYVLMSADLAQEEPRIIAYIAKDETILQAVRDGKDIYRPATEALYPYTLSDAPDAEWKPMWDAWERYNGKQFVLAWYYGAGAPRLKKLDPTLTNPNIVAALAMLNDAHPARKAYLDETWEQIERYGYTSSLYGRKRWFPDAWSKKKSERDEALRKAANMRVQGTAADMLKMVLPRLDKQLDGMRSGLLFTVYDELVLEVHETELDEVAEIVQGAFADFLPGVGLPIEVMVGERWGERVAYK